jgi:helix-turn-helix protein
MKEQRENTVNQKPNELLKKIGIKLARRRKELGYKNSDTFAYDKDLNRSQYGKYEAGSQNLRFSSLVKIINALGLTIEEFFGEGLDSRVEHRKQRSR